MKKHLLHTIAGSCLILTGVGCAPARSGSVKTNSEATRFSSQDDVVQLGKRIFEDKTLSEPQGTACASCHDPARAFTGSNRSPIPGVAKGALPQAFGIRNSPTAMYAHFSPEFNFTAETSDTGEVEYVPNGGQFWDGRASNLAQQAKGPFLNAREMNNASPASVVDKVAKGPYAALFKAVFGAEAFTDSSKAFDQIAEAIAAYETSSALSPFNSKFDAVLRGEEQFTQLEAEGFALFKDTEKGNCLACHAGNPESKNPQDWIFTDFTYDSLGAPRNSEIPDFKDPSFFDLGLCKQAGLATRMPEGFDLASVCGAFKVPTLRNVAITGPYMHNGSLKTLRDVVKFYVTRDTNPELWYPTDSSGKVQKFNDLPENYHGNVNTGEVPYDRKPGEEPRLNDAEIDAVEAFLQTLTDR